MSACTCGSGWVVITDGSDYDGDVGWGRQMDPKCPVDGCGCDLKAPITITNHVCRFKEANR